MIVFFGYLNKSNPNLDLKKKLIGMHEKIFSCKREKKLISGVFLNKKRTVLSDFGTQEI